MTSVPHVISISGRLATYPVLTTGARWPSLREDKGPEPYFAMFPEVRGDPERNDFGSVTEYPPPFARGGGLFPVLALLDDGRLCCASRTGATHRLSPSEISLSFSGDRGRSWSDYRVAVRGDADREIDVRNPTLGRSADGHLVLGYGIVEGFAPNDVGVEEHKHWMEVIRSADDGHTWSEPVRVPAPAGTTLSPHGQMRTLADGTLVFNARGSHELRRYADDPTLPVRISFLYRSHDGGLTWRSRPRSAQIRSAQTRSAQTRSTGTPVRRGSSPSTTRTGSATSGTTTVPTGSPTRTTPAGPGIAGWRAFRRAAFRRTGPATPRPRSWDRGTGAS